MVNYRSALNEVQAYVDSLTQKAAEFSLSEVAAETLVWINSKAAPDTTDSIFLQVLDALESDTHSRGIRDACRIIRNNYEGAIATPRPLSLRDRLLLEVFDQMTYGLAQQAVARHRSGKILHHGQVRNLQDWKLELHQRILVIQGWKELIIKGGKFRPGQHKDLLEMTGTDFAAAALNRRLRAKVENDIADLWDQVGRDIGMKKVKEVFPTIEEFAAHTLVLQGVDIPTS